MAKKIKKIDPISEKYFKPLEDFGRYKNILFLLTVAISFIVVMVDKTSNPQLYSILQIFFLLLVVLLNIFSLVIQLYFFPKAQERRYQDFLAHAYNKKNGDEQTLGYYNNNQIIPSRRIAAQTLENSFYSRKISSKMAWKYIVKFGVYFIVWFILLLCRQTNLTIILVVSEVILSEQILSQLFKILFLHCKFDKTYNDLVALFQTGASDDVLFEVKALEIAGDYEMAKASGGITLSSKIFEKINVAEDINWKKLAKSLSL